MNNKYVTHTHTHTRVVTSAGMFKGEVNMTALIFNYLCLTPRRAVHLLGGVEFPVEMRCTYGGTLEEILFYVLTE